MATLTELDIFFDSTQPSVLALRASTTDWARLKGELSALFICIKHLLVINFFLKGLTFKVM